MSHWSRIVARAGLLALLLAAGLCGGPGAFAEEEPAADAASARALLEKGLDALRMRMQAATKEADLLAAQGRVEEALARYREAGRIYDQAFAQLRELIERATGPRPEAPPAGGPALPAAEASAPTAAAEAVARGLRWLAAHQSPDGSFDAAGFGRWADGAPVAAERAVPGAGKPIYTVGTTGLAVLAFLGAGHTPAGGGPYGPAVARALSWLVGVQDPEGCVGPRTTQQYIYNHAIGGLALVEAYGLTGHPQRKAPAQRALDFAALSRNPYFAWRYGVKPGDNDTSVTTWMLMLMASGRAVNQAAVARGRPPELAIDDAAFEGAMHWFEKATDPDYGRVGYVQRGAGPARPTEMVDRFPAERSESMTAAALFGRVLCGQDPRAEVWQKGLKLVRDRLPTWNEHDGSIDMYYWYYGTLACFHAGGEAWRAWSRALQDALLPNQRRDGGPTGLLGSFDPVGPWGADGGRVYATALMTLALEVVARFEQAGPRAR